LKRYVTTILIIILLLSSSFIVVSNSSYNQISDLDETMQPLQTNNADKISEYTLSVLRYDHLRTSSNYGPVNMPKPTPGVILVPTNMMCIEICRAAVSVYNENKTFTLKNLEEFDLENMVVGLPYMFWHMWASKNSMPCCGQKYSAQEMSSIGDRCPHANIVGDCYSQSAFNTAVLRLCGFSPEEVFTLLMPAHAVTIVKINDTWLVFDSVQAQFLKRAIHEIYYPPIEDIIYWLENDKYFINFGTPYPEVFPYQDDPYSNIDPEILLGIVEHIVPLFNNSKLGGKDWEINDFIENSIESPDMITTEVPYTVEDATGLTDEEKANSLLNLNKDFIFSQTGGEEISQYDRSIYAKGFLDVEHPQAYANASRHASWTSFFGRLFNRKLIIHDYLRTAYFIKILIKNKQILPDDCVSFSDFTIVRSAGSSIDQAILAYGTLRNIKKRIKFWQPEDLFVLVTDENKGYLAVNTIFGWKYLNFEKGKTIIGSPPEQIKMVFNEIDYYSEWNK
jgi:hypothetical protein